jgi:phage-related minor tail protein
MELFKLVGTIIINNQEANEALADTADKAEETGKETEGTFGKISQAAGGIVKAIAGAGVALGGAWLAAIEGSREYRTEMGKLDSAFQTAGHSSEVAKKTYSDLNAVLGDTGQAVEASQHLAVLAKNEKDLSTWTDICTGVYATFGESLPIEGLTEAANETAKTGTLTGGLTDALNWAGISEEKFQEKLDKCSNEQERQKLIMDTLNKTYKDASDQYKETNKDVIESQKAQERLTDAFAEIGRVGEPILTRIKDKVAEMVEAAVPHLENFIQKVKDIITWVKENGDTIDKWVGVILGAGTAIGLFLLILNWGTIMTAAANAIKVVRTAILAFNTALLSNPIGLIVSLLAGLVVAFVYLWNNVDGFREFWINTWNKIKQMASSAWESIKKTFSNIGKWFSEQFQKVQKAGKEAMENVKKWFSDAYKSVTKTFSNIGSWFRNTFQTAWKNIKSVFSSWGSFFGDLWTKIKNKFSSIGSALGTAMGNAVKNGLNRVIATVEMAINKGIGLINGAINLANKLPGVNVGKVAEVSLHRLAKGGVLEKGQVGVLEGSGAEAVVPLEHNKAWLSRVAEDLYDIQLEKGSYHNGIDPQLMALLNHISEQLDKLAELRIYLNSGALVGELVPAIDGRMADRWNHALRGNTR